MGLIVVIGTAFILLKDPVREVLARFEIARAIDAANRTNRSGPKLVCDIDFAGSLARHFSGTVPERHARRVLRLTQNAWSAAALHARAVALLLTKRPLYAAETANAIDAAHRTASMWTNLAAIEFVTAGPARDHDHLLNALVAVDEALVRNPASTEAGYDRELIVRAIVSATGEDDDAAWKRATEHFESLTDADLVRLTQQHPEQARIYAESVYLCSWAEDISNGTAAKAGATLHRITVIADTLHAHGEGFLWDVVSAIQLASQQNDESKVFGTAKALILYRAGRKITSEHAPGLAEQPLGKARDAFHEAGSPMVDAADCYRAINLIDANRSSEAKALLAGVIASQRKSVTPHPALLAFSLYHSALIDAKHGDWSESLTSANEAMLIFRRLGERRLAGTVEGLLSQVYEFLGQPQLAWQHGLAGIELSLPSGDVARARAIMAALSRAELRHSRWRFALALIGVERTIAARVADAPQASDMSIRIATAEAHMGRAQLANVAMADARRRAGAVADTALRAKLLADVDAADGSLARSEPARALTLLSSAISFEERAGRAIVLPALYLERGRCFVSLHRDAEANRDFEAGIAALERQRSRTVAMELRPGIFDDASDLFEEAVLLALRRGAPNDAFDYVERGRARAVLEEIAARSPVEVSAGHSAGVVMRALGPNDLLLEYAALPHHLVTFAIDSTRCTFVISPRARAVDRLDAQSLVSALANRLAWERIEPISARLYNAFLGQMRGRLATKRNVIIVGEASMQQLPFAALFDRNARRFVIEDHSIVAAPSAAVYVLSARRHVTETASPATAAIFANPLPHAPPFEKLSPLPASETEGQSVARGYPKAHLAVRDQATVSAFRNVAPLFDVVHFAGHAVRYPAEPWRSALMFASSGHDDGTLSVEEVAHLRFIRTRVVILAACSTLRAQKGGIEGVPSLARAFLIAGVPAVVGTLADVDDFEATTLLSRLHGGIRGGLAPADALRASQLAVLHGDDPALRHPGYWSAFAILGAGFGR